MTSSDGLLSTTVGAYKCEIGLIKHAHVPDDLELRVQDPVHEEEGVEPRVVDRVACQSCDVKMSL